MKKDSRPPVSRPPVLVRSYMTRAPRTIGPRWTLAQAHDLDVAPHGSQDIHVHLVSAIANGLILEYYRDTVDPMWARMYHHTLRVNDDGTVSPPNVPGHGAELVAV